jgi:hypothetical protein
MTGNTVQDSRGVGEINWLIRGCNYDLSVLQLLIELGTLAVLVGSSDELVALLFQPFSNPEFVLGSS